MNRSLVLAEWKRAAESLGAARSCSQYGFHADAVSRAYYSVLHGAKAALQLQDLSAESHAAVKRLFGLHLVQTSLVEAEWGTFLGESYDVRLMADYDVETHLSETDAQEACGGARAFLTRIRELLLTSGLTQEEIRTDVLGP